ncbi:hypothetical protein EDEG_04069, partial [Edhazardia aedis USNM 41457]
GTINSNVIKKNHYLYLRFNPYFSFLFNTLFCLFLFLQSGFRKIYIFIKLSLFWYIMCIFPSLIANKLICFFFAEFESHLQTYKILNVHFSDTISNFHNKIIYNNL